MKKIFLLNLFLSYSFLFGAQVVKISKNRINMAVSSDSGAPWEVGQKVCVQNKQRQTFCGTVIKVRQEGTICKMTSPLNGVVPGDVVTSKSGPSPGESLGESSGGSLSDGEANYDFKLPRESEKVGVGFGLRLGWVLTTISSDQPASNFSLGGGRNLGLLVDLPLVQSGRISLETGLNFLQLKVLSLASSVESNVLDLPVWLKAKFFDGDPSPYIFVGPYLAYLLSAKYVSSSGESDAKSSLNTLDIGLVSGLGFNFRLGKGSELGVSGSYCFGLTNTNALSLAGHTTVNKNRRLQFLVHLIFRG
jgi:hypothetical protein